MVFTTNRMELNVKYYVIEYKNGICKQLSEFNRFIKPIILNSLKLELIIVKENEGMIFEIIAIDINLGLP